MHGMENRWPPPAPGKFPSRSGYSLPGAAKGVAWEVHLARRIECGDSLASLNQIQILPFLALRTPGRALPASYCGRSVGP